MVPALKTTALKTTALGEAIASYGRIFKILHILQFIDVGETYRRDIKDVRNLQGNRHSARTAWPARARKRRPRRSWSR